MIVEIDLDNMLKEYIDEQKLDINIDIEKNIYDIVEIALTENNINIEKVSISIECMSENEIQKLNREYRNIDRPTDVLSFPIFDREEMLKISKQTDEEKKIKELELGDIILCLDIIKRQSLEYNTGIVREVLYMITHGVCHLLGFDHIEECDKKEMRKLEENILNKIGVVK